MTPINSEISRDSLIIRAESMGYSAHWNKSGYFKVEGYSPCFDKKEATELLDQLERKQKFWVKP